MFSEGLHEVSIVAIGLMDMARKSRHSKIKNRDATDIIKEIGEAGKQ